MNTLSHIETPRYPSAQRTTRRHLYTAGVVAAFFFAGACLAGSIVILVIIIRA